VVETIAEISPEIKVIEEPVRVEQKPRQQKKKKKKK
jgi:hypothetical protein